MLWECYSMINIKNLVYEYPGTLALKNVTFDVHKSSITALVGPNGAGKTTLLRCIAALDVPLSGSVHINDIDVLENPRKIHQMIGYLSDFYGMYAELSVQQSLHYAALSHSIHPDKVKQAVIFAAERLQITDRLEAKVGALSRGLSQRLAIAQAIVHEPKLLLLDEPAAGLDPEARHALSELFVKLKNQGMTLMVSSHILAELEEYSTSMIILKHGEVIDHNILSTTDSSSITLTISTLTNSAELSECLSEQDDIHIINRKDLSCTIQMPADKQKSHQLLALLLQKNIPVYQFGPEKINMQDAYLQTVANHSKTISSDD